MRPGGRIQAAIEVLGDIETRRRPVAAALKDWGLNHRFAGSGDRAAIAGLVYDALRYRASTAWRMGSDAPHALVLGMLVFRRGESVETLETRFAGDRFAPRLPEGAERQSLASPRGLDEAPGPVAGDYPEWLDASLRRGFGEGAVAEAAALAARAPLDLRVNTLKADQDKVARALASHKAVPTPIAPQGLRIAAPEDGGRPPHVQSEAGYAKGWFEVQDEGSQIAAALCLARAGMQVADICAGAGGKTLALAAAMAGRGQVHAYDTDRRRLVPIHERVQRAGARNVQVHAPDQAALDLLAARMDTVLVDAPCTGTGTWRRNPDAKWRVRENALADRITEQRAVLDLARALVKPGGRLVYVTCSLLPEENDDQIRAFLDRAPEFAALAGPAVWAEAFQAGPSANIETRHGLQLTPLRTGTDGFYVAVLERVAD